jgi:hypothetical protein
MFIYSMSLPPILYTRTQQNTRSSLPDYYTIILNNNKLAASKTQYIPACYNTQLMFLTQC